MEEQLESLLEILLEILPTSTGQLETIPATKNYPRHTHRTPNTWKISLKTIRVETCHFSYLKNHTSISFNKKTTIKSNFLGKTKVFFTILFRACLINVKDLSLYFRVGFQICFYSYLKVSSRYLLVFGSYF